MRAMVLAAGMGERMMPLTLRTPKPAIPLLGAPLLAHVLRGLAKDGFRDVVVNAHHLPKQLESLLGDGTAHGLRGVHVSLETDLLGTGGGVRRAGRWLRGQGPFLVRNADFLADIPLQAVLEAHRGSGCPATLVLAPARAGYATVEVSAEGRVLSLAGKPEADPARVVQRCLFTGYQILEEELLDHLPANGPSDLVRDLYWSLAAAGRLNSWSHLGFWWEYGSPDQYLEGVLRLLDLPPLARERLVTSDPVLAIGSAVVAAGPGAEFPSGVELAGRVVFGQGSRASPGSSITDSIVLDGATVGTRCALRRVVVGPETVVPAGSQLDDVLVCSGEGVEQSDLPTSVLVRGPLLVRPLRPAHAPSA